MSKLPRPEALFADIDHNPPKADWMDVPAEIKPGRYCYAANPESVKYVELPNAHKWNPLDDDWGLPENWQEIIYNGLRERLDKYRSLKLFMDICVRCGACADKCGNCTACNATRLIGCCGPQVPCSTAWGTPSA